MPALSSGPLRPAHLSEADAELAEAGGIAARAHRGLGGAADDDLADPVDLRVVLGEDRGGGVVDGPDRQDVRGHRHDQDRRVRRVDLAIARVTGERGRQLAASGVDGRLYVAGGGVDIFVEVELKGDV